MRLWAVLLSLLLGAALPTAGVAGAAPLRVGIIPIVANAPLYCLLEHGNPAAEGLEIQITEMQSGTKIVEALAAGSVDIAFSATLSILQAAAQGLDLVIVAPASFKSADDRATPTSAIIARAAGGATGGAGLRGKTFAVNSLRSLDYVIAAEYLTRAGVAPREVSWRELAYPHMAPALDQGRVDAAIVAEPLLTILRDSGRIAVLSTALDIIPGTSVSAYAALRSFTQARAPLIESFQRALRRGVEACERDPQRLRAAVAKHTGAKPELVQRIGLPIFRPVLRPADIAPLVELARRHGVLERAVELDRVLGAGTR
jgi:NitT/TauT family transport system substrate-binding protein